MPPERVHLYFRLVSPHKWGASWRTAFATGTSRDAATLLCMNSPRFDVRINLKVHQILQVSVLPNTGKLGQPLRGLGVVIRKARFLSGIELRSNRLTLEAEPETASRSSAGTTW